ncbi:MAG TPA: hypothetical protein ENK82_08890 [Campylobacterales bacterium]|nr:hypothetical protein [Campylobacterales bacterium]HHS93452.1 hypothetical protein [Campylobacterales bacterium]
MFKVFEVSGYSLYPLLKEAERIFCIKVFSFSSLKPLDIVVFYKEPQGLMIKQIKSIDQEQYFVVGTNADSIDSRDFGTISKNEIKYKLLFKF